MCPEVHCNQQSPLSHANKLTWFNDPVYVLLWTFSLLTLVVFLIFLSIIKFHLFIHFQHIYSDIQEASWPASHTNADIRRLPDGTTQITSICQCATLKLTSTRQQFCVEFLCKVPREINQKTIQVKADVDVKSQDRNASHNACVGTPELPTNTTDVKSEQCRNNFSEKQWKSYQGSPLLSDGFNSLSGYQSYSASYQPCDFSHESKPGGCAYVWIVQHYSVDDCPPCWRHPLQMVLGFAAACTHLPAGQGENPSDTKVCNGYFILTSRMQVAWWVI